MSDEKEQRLKKFNKQWAKALVENKEWKRLANELIVAEDNYLKLTDLIKQKPLKKK